MNLEELKAKWREEEEFEKGGIARTIRCILADLDDLEPSDAELVGFGMNSYSPYVTHSRVFKQIILFESAGDMEEIRRWKVGEKIPDSARAILLEAWRKEQGHGS